MAHVDEMTNLSTYKSGCWHDRDGIVKSRSRHWASSKSTLTRCPTSRHTCVTSQAVRETYFLTTVWAMAPQREAMVPKRGKRQQARLRWRDNVYAAVDVTWQTHPLCQQSLMGPSCLMDRSPPGEAMKRHGRDKARGNHKKAAIVQSTSIVLPSSGPTVRETPTSCEGCTTNNRLWSNCNCGNGADLYGHVDGNGTTRGAFQGSGATLCT